MAKIPIQMITKHGSNTESYYDYIISRFVAPYFTVFFNRLKIKKANLITLLSFILLLIASILAYNISGLSVFSYRLIIAVLIQLSFIFDCSDGQLARITNTTSELGAWLDRILDRLGEFIIFTSFGIIAWLQYGKIIFLIMGLITGYLLTAFSLSLTLVDSVLLENVKKILNLEPEKRREVGLLDDDEGHDVEEKGFFKLIKKLLFFLNFGIGERYLYLSFFILINRIDIMLFISTFLVILRVIGISVYSGKKLKRIDQLLKDNSGEV